MAKRKTLGVIAQEAFCKSANKGEWCETNWDRAAAAVEAEVLRRVRREGIRLATTADENVTTD